MHNQSWYRKLSSSLYSVLPSNMSSESTFPSPRFLLLLCNGWWGCGARGWALGGVLLVGLVGWGLGRGVSTLLGISCCWAGWGCVACGLGRGVAAPLIVAQGLPPTTQLRYSWGPIVIFQLRRSGSLRREPPILNDMLNSNLNSNIQI